MKKINKLTTQFPNIFRIIPERISLKTILSSKLMLYMFSGLITAICLVFVLVVILIGVGLYKNTRLLIARVDQRQQIQNKIIFWQSIAQKYSGYKDAYFQIAVLEYQLGDLNSAKQENSKALLLDPNFNDAKQLESLLTKTN